MLHNVYSQQHTYMHSSHRSSKFGLSHLDPYAVHRGGCLELYYCNMVEWFWWDSSTQQWFCIFCSSPSLLGKAACEILVTMFCTLWRVNCDELILWRIDCKPPARHFKSSRFGGNHDHFYKLLAVISDSKMVCRLQFQRQVTDAWYSVDVQKATHCLHQVLETKPQH